YPASRRCLALTEKSTQCAYDAARMAKELPCCVAIHVIKKRTRKSCTGRRVRRNGICRLRRHEWHGWVLTTSSYAAPLSTPRSTAACRATELSTTWKPIPACCGLGIPVQDEIGRR